MKFGQNKQRCDRGTRRIRRIQLAVSCPSALLRQLLTCHQSKTIGYKTGSRPSSCCSCARPPNPGPELPLALPGKIRRIHTSVFLAAMERLLRLHAIHSTCKWS
jgi:hypothetical protein